MIAKPKPEHGDIFAHGGPEVTTRSQFFKGPDVFRSSIERQAYGKSSRGGELSKLSGDSKSEKPVNPTLPVAVRLPKEKRK